MANIMITKRCNLNCEYCFANEFVNDEEAKKSDISIDRFKEIMDFILGDGTVKEIGLIGGEPTCHHNFKEILKILKNDSRVEGVTIYTNGIRLKEYIDDLSDKKFHILINCNDIADKKDLYNDFHESLKVSFQSIKERIVFGANYYKLDYNYSYILDLLKEFPNDRLRVSISVPNTENYNYEPLEYFQKIKPKIFEYFRELKKLGTIPFLDCNIFPACLVTAEELSEFDAWGIDNPFSILKNRQTNCTPVIDILPDYTAVRCFGLSEYTKVSIKDFASIMDLRNYYIRTIDAYAINTNYNEKCDSCYKYKTMKCSGGCLIYKIKDIMQKSKDNRGYHYDKKY